MIQPVNLSAHIPMCVTHLHPKCQDHIALSDLQTTQNALLQNALKIFKSMPKSLMDIVKRTDASTVTQHGLYMRPLTDPSLHPLVAKAPPAEPPNTPPAEEEHKTGSLAASHSPDTIVTTMVKHSEDGEQPAPQETKRADAVSTSPSNAPASAEMTGAPAANSSVPTGNSLGSVGTSSTAVKAPSTTKGSPTGATPARQTGSDVDPGKEAESPADVHEGWGRGRVSLLGDAAHATIPNGARLLFFEHNNAHDVMRGTCLKHMITYAYMHLSFAAASHAYKGNPGAPRTLEGRFLPTISVQFYCSEKAETSLCTLNNS